MSDAWFEAEQGENYRELGHVNGCCAVGRGLGEDRGIEEDKDAMRL